MAKGFVVAWFAANPDIIVHTFKPRPQDKYGRWLADICTVEGFGGDAMLSFALSESGNAVEADY